MPYARPVISPSPGGRGRDGFSLIMVSILITAAAILLASMLPGSDAGDYNAKTISDVRKIERIEEATRAFMAFNGRRPCPADGQYAVGNIYFGVEGAIPGTCTGGSPAAPMGPDAGTGYIVSGTVPTRSLGLSDDYAFDAFGRRFTYVVDRRATDSIATAKSAGRVSGCYNLMQNIRYNGARPDLVIEDGTHTILDNTMYAYISHGPSGYGAFPPQGSTVANRINSGSTDADMQTNAGVNSSFTYSTSNFTNIRVRKDRVLPAAGDTGFDDLIYYRDDLKNTCCLGTNCSPPGFVVQGNYGLFGGGGKSSVTIADVNGDGIPDLIIGAPTASPNGSNSGSVYVVFGTRTGFPDPLPLNTLNGTNGFELDGAAPNDDTGSSVAAGDVNGDGVADIIIGAGTASPNGSDSGSVYVVFGGAARKDGTGWTSCPCTLNASFLNGTNGVEFDGAAAQDYAGWAVTAGDVNGDGIADVIIGAQGAQSGDGATYVVFGKKAGWLGTAKLDSTLLDGTKGVEFDGGTMTFAGSSVAAGDINGDGIADIIIGAGSASPGGKSYAGSVYVVFGRQCGGSYTACTTPVTLNSTFLNGTKGVEFDGAMFSDYAGSSIATGDVNGDNVADLIIGAPGANGGAFNGAVYIVFGRQCGGNYAACTTPVTLSSTFLNGTNGVEFDGTASGSAGSSVAAGDVNGDGISDLIVGAPYSSNGAVYVVFGKQAGWTGAATTLNSTFLNGANGVEFDHTYFDPAVAIAAGDVNGDGTADLIVNTLPGGLFRYGFTYVYFGEKTGWSATPYNLGGL
ncbi:MAG: FG-GAP repeat protein [Pseudomonadota bacterium]|nr:FG-GAP repeat protein [Pseudomonadota bacterium]